MSNSKGLNRIKKLYGEKFMHFCRSIFPPLLEQEGLLTEVLKSTFATNSRTLYDDIVNNDLEEEFKNYIYSKIDVEKEKPEIYSAAGVRYSGNGPHSGTADGSAGRGILHSGYNQRQNF